MARKDGKPKPQIKKPSPRNQHSFTKPRSIPDLPETATCSHSPSKECPQNNTSVTKAPSAPYVATLGLSANLGSGEIAIPNVPRIIPSALPPIFQSTISLEAPTFNSVMGKSVEGKQSENKEVSASASASAKRSSESEYKLVQEQNPVLKSPQRRSRKQPRRFGSKEPESKPKKKSMFEGISRDSLQRYMAHYNIPRRQDLKKNLVPRVHYHFNEILDHTDINLEELNNGVRARLHQLNKEPVKRGKK